jgi:hypothetical protein
MAAGGEEPVPVGDEADQEEAGHEDEGRPVLGRCGPGMVRGEERRDEEERPAGDR